MLTCAKTVGDTACVEKACVGNTEVEATADAHGDCRGGERHQGKQGRYLELHLQSW
jgi:hypothetical protein